MRDMIALNMVVDYPSSRETGVFRFSSLLQIEPAIGKIEALVAEREIGNLLSPECHCQPLPVVKRGVDDLVPGKLTRLVGDGDVTDLAAPPLGQR